MHINKAVMTRKPQENEQSPWFPRSNSKPNAQYRVLCLPYAGGSASLFRTWDEFVGNDIEIVPIELPGRGMRVNETLASDMESLATELAEVISLINDKPFILFGHSMGGRIAYYLYHKLVAMGAPIPDRLALSACNPPQISSPANKPWEMDNQTFARHLQRMGGTPNIILESQDMLDLFIPILKSDLRLASQSIAIEEKVKIPVTVLFGTDDHIAPKASMLTWQDRCECPIDICEIQGGHFFLKDKANKIVNVIIENLSNNDDS